jgi:hypothetical protein
MTPTAIIAAVGAIVADGIALAVSFSVDITSAQQAAILAFVGTTTTLIVGIIYWLQGKKIVAATAIAVTAPVAAKDHAAAVSEVLK